MNQRKCNSPSLFNGWRIAGWSAALALLALPAIAMQFTGEVDWTLSDFVFAAIIFGLVGLAIELTVKLARTKLKVLALLVAIFAAFFTVWSNLAVGILGNEDNPVNLGFFVLLLAGLITGLAVRFRARPMVWIAASLAAGQFAIGIYAATTADRSYVEWGVLAFFAFIWSFSAMLFAKARRT